MKREIATLTETNNLIDTTVDIVAAYAANNALAGSDLPDLVVAVHNCLAQLQHGIPFQEANAPRPAVPVHRSVKSNYIVCLEDGLRFKSMRRHLMAKYGLSPDQYRARWGLSKEYPMVAPNVAAQRSSLAKQMGLAALGVQGAKRKKATAAIDRKTLPRAHRTP